jgi:hypothetical protein
MTPLLARLLEVFLFLFAGGLVTGIFHRVRIRHDATAQHQLSIQEV